MRIALALKEIEYDYEAVHLVKDGGEQLKDEYAEVRQPYGNSTVCTVQSSWLESCQVLPVYLMRGVAM